MVSLKDAAHWTKYFVVRACFSAMNKNVSFSVENNLKLFIENAWSYKF